MKNRFELKNARKVQEPLKNVISRQKNCGNAGLTKTVNIGSIMVR